jgi:hypothetical protein
MVAKGRGDRGSAQRDLLLEGESPELREKIEGFETVADDTPALPAAGAGRRPGPAAISIMAKLERCLVSSV